MWPSAVMRVRRVCHEGAGRPFLAPGTRRRLRQSAGPPGPGNRRQLPTMVCLRRLPHACLSKEPTMNRTIIVARIAPDAHSAVAEIFKNSDATELPHELGVERRSLYSLGDIYL